MLVTKGVVAEVGSVYEASTLPRAYPNTFGISGFSGVLSTEQVFGPLETTPAIEQVALLVTIADPKPRLEKSNNSKQTANLIAQ